MYEISNYGFIDFILINFSVGKVRNKFPLEMAEIQAPAVAADINDDGKLEIVTADSHGNVAAWTAQGEEIWQTHLKSLIPQASNFPYINYLLNFNPS